MTVPRPGAASRRDAPLHPVTWPGAPLAGPASAALFPGPRRRLALPMLASRYGR